MRAALVALLPGATLAMAAERVTSPLEERLRPGETQDKQPRNTAPIAPAPAKARIESGAESSVLIRSIKFEGVRVPAIVANAARPFIGRTASRAALEDLASALTAAYERSDVALFTVVIPRQSFEDGLVRVLTAEGFVESVTLDGEAADHANTLVTAFAERLTREKPASRRTLERQLSLINDIPGLKTASSFSYGQRPGAVRLTLALDYQRPTVSAGFSNRSSRFVKDGQFTGAAKAYRLLRDGDFTSLKLAASVNFEDSLYAGLQHTTPLGASGARADIGAALLRSRPSGTVIEGDAQIYTAGVSYPVIRDYRTTLSMRAGVDIVNSDNAAFGSLIATERTRAAGLSAAFARNWETRRANFSAEIKRGAPVAGARVSGLIGDAEYFKARIDAAIVQSLGDSWRLKANAALQWTDDNLPASERFSVGGARFGRAFSAGLINADRGAALLLEPAWRPINGGAFARSEIYAFADYAYVESFARPGGDNRYVDLGSAGGGVRIAYRDKGSLELEMARPFDQPAAGFEQDWRFSASWRIDIRP